MLKLELVRYNFLAVCTFGVLYSRDGWTCLTGENVVRPDGVGERGHTAIMEGLYQLKLVNHGHGVIAVGVFEHPTAVPVSFFSNGDRAAVAHGNILLGTGVSLDTGVMSGGVDAVLELIKRVQENEETFLNIRHLDHTQHAHFERMRKTVAG